MNNPFRALGSSWLFWVGLSPLIGLTELWSQSGERAFRQLEDQLPTPNAYRMALGAPGSECRQQRSDYDLSVGLDAFFYVMILRNRGGFVMPVIIKIRNEDGSHELREYPAEIWRDDSQRVSKLMVLDRAVAQIEWVPFVQTADTDRENNYYPRRIEREDFDLKKPEAATNPMQKARESQRSQGEESEP